MEFLGLDHFTEKTEKKHDHAALLRFDLMENQNYFSSFIVLKCGNQELFKIQRNETRSLDVMLVELIVDGCV